MCCIIRGAEMHNVAILYIHINLFDAVCVNVLDKTALLPCTCSYSARITTLRAPAYYHPSDIVLGDKHPRIP